MKTIIGRFKLTKNGLISIDDDTFISLDELKHYKIHLLPGDLWELTR